MSTDLATTTNALTDAKNAIQAQVAADLLEDYALWRRETRSGDDPSEMRRLVEYQTRVIGAEVDRRADINANLPIFNFTFHAPTGEMSATVTMPEVQTPALPKTRARRKSKQADVEDIEDVEPVMSTPTWAQDTQEALSRKDLPDDLVDLMAQIPGMMADD